MIFPLMLSVADLDRQKEMLNSLNAKEFICFDQNELFSIFK